jgi:hypothetical protein
MGYHDNRRHLNHFYHKKTFYVTIFNTLMFTEGIINIADVYS